MSTAARKGALREAGRCYICTQRGHRADQCTSGRSCHRCQGKHHIFICDSPETRYPGSQPPGSNTPQTNSTTKTTPGNSVLPRPQQGTYMQPPNPGSSHVCAAHTLSSADITLKTAMVVLYGPHGATKRIRCLLDTASHRTYITEEVAEFLELNKTGIENLNVGGYGGGYVSSSLTRYTL